MTDPRAECVHIVIEQSGEDFSVQTVDIEPDLSDADRAQRARDEEQAKLLRGQDKC